MVWREKGKRNTRQKHEWKDETDKYTGKAEQQKHEKNSPTGRGMTGKSDILLLRE